MQKERNPFRNKLIITYVEYVTDVSNFVAAGDRYGFEIEAGASVNVYTSKAHREFVWSLSASGRDMFLAMQYFVQPDSETIILTYDKMQALTPTIHLSPRRYEDTIRELIKANVIEYKDRKKGVFWYDPQLFFSGNRMEAFPECTIKVATKYAKPRKLR